MYFSLIYLFIFHLLPLSISYQHLYKQMSILKKLVSARIMNGNYTTPPQKKKFKLCKLIDHGWKSNNIKHEIYFTMYKYFLSSHPSIT